MSSPRRRLLSLLPMPADVVLDALGDLAERTELTLLPSSTVPELHAALADAEIVLGAWQSAGAQRLDADAVAAAGPGLAFVQQPSAGVDVLDGPTLTARGVPVANAAGANARGVAEWAVAAFGCDVAYWSRMPKDVPYPFLEPAALCARSDILVLALPLTPETHGLVSTELLAAMPPAAYVINVGRGNALDHAALLAALEDGRLGGAALDVFPEEPLPAGDPLRANDRILLSPHAAGATRQSVQRIIERSVASLHRAVAGEPVIDVVNGLDPRIRRRL